MKYTRFPVLQYAFPLTALAIGAILLIPGDDRPARIASVDEAPERSLPSYLAASPELVADLNASLVETDTDGDVLAREASLPDPSATTVPVVPQSGPVASEMLAANQPAPEDEQPTDPATALRVGDVAVNMRAGPSTSTAVIRPLQPGEPLVYGEAEGGWISVTTEAGETGWVYGTYLSGPALAARDTDLSGRDVAEVPDRDEPREIGGRYARVGSDVYLRAGPSQSTDRLFVVEAGERVQVAETRGGWARIILPSGASGWVRMK